MEIEINERERKKLLGLVKYFIRKQEKNDQFDSEEERRENIESWEKIAEKFDEVPSDSIWEDKEGERIKIVRYKEIRYNSGEFSFVGLDEEGKETGINGDGDVGGLNMAGWRRIK